VNNSGATTIAGASIMAFPSGMSGRATREHRPSATNVKPEHAMFTCRLSGGRAVSQPQTNTPDADGGQRLVDKDFAVGWERRSHNREQFIMNLDQVSVIIGIDWADRTHLCCLLGKDGVARQTVPVGASAEDFGSWIDTVEQQCPDGKIAAAIERSEGAMVEMLLSRPRWVVVPINPVVLHRFRQAFAPSGAKNDPGDAALLAEIVRTHPERFDPLRPADELLTELSALVKERRHWVNTRTRLVEQLIAVLKKYYPQAMELMGETLGSPMTLAFLQHWPDLASARKAKWSTLDRFYRQHHSGRDDVLQRRRALLRVARPVSDREAYVHPYRLHMLAIVRQIIAAQTSIAQFDAMIAERYARAPGHEVIDSLPGAGPVFAPRLWVACAGEGAQPDATTMQLKSGIAPVQQQSGNSKVVRFRWARPHFVHQTWTEFAYHSLPTCAWAHAYYQARKTKGHGEGAILRALAFKWIRIVARLWRDQVPYDERYYLQHCAARLAAA
jgi:transposase